MVSQCGVMSRPRLLLVACRVFEREIEALAPSAKTELSVRYLEIALHERPGLHLRAALQEEIDAVPEDSFDAVGLGYGLCNRGLLGLVARGLPVIVPRAHDCLGVLLGGSRRYLDEMEKEPGTYFQSPGWIEHLPADRSIRPMAAGDEMSAKKEEFVAKYGEEAAQFLMEEYGKFTRHYKRLTFVSTPVAGLAERERVAGEIAARQGWTFQRLEGDVGWLRRLVDGEWTDAEFLVLKPGERTAPSYGEELIAAEPA